MHSAWTYKWPVTDYFRCYSYSRIDNISFDNFGLYHQNKQGLFPGLKITENTDVVKAAGKVISIS